MADTWTNEAVTELIDLYEERPCLYDTKHKDYYNRDLRGRALSEIADKTGFSGKMNLYLASYILYKECSV